MKKSYLILPITVVVLGIAYLIYDLVKPSLTNPCESIFQQTSLSLKSNLDIIKSKGEVFIGRQKIQELTEQAQLAALTLKTCCIMSENGVLDAENFLRCKDGASQYKKQLAAVSYYINEAQQAKQQGEQKALDEAILRMKVAAQKFQITTQQMKEDFFEEQSKLLTSGQSAQTDTLRKNENGMTAPDAEVHGGKINLLSKEAGGHLVAATSDYWLKSIDGNENYFTFYESNLGGATEAVFAFKNERTATFDAFKVLILDTRSGNLKDFELLWGNESATGEFHSIGKFQTNNIKLFDTPYQEFKFSPVKSKYFKIRLLSPWQEHGQLIEAREFQLWGSLQ